MNKKYIIGIIVSLILLLVIGGVVWLNYQKEQANIVQEIDRQLAAEDREIFENRIVEIDQALLQNPDNETRYDLLTQKGLNLFSLGKLAESIVYYKLAAEVDPGQGNAFKAMYHSYLEMNDYKNALISIQKTVELRTLDADAWRKYVYLEKEQLNASNERVREIYRQAESATTGWPPHIDIVTSYAQFLGEIGDYERSIEYWQEAIELNAADKELYEQEIERLNQKMEVR